MQISIKLHAGLQINLIMDYSMLLSVFMDYLTLSVYRLYSVTTQVVSRWLPTAAARVPASGHVGFVVDKVALGQVFSEYFCFPC
jgi:hypothetical protein